MEDSDKIKLLYDAFQHLNGNFHVLEYRVPVHVQMMYFKQAAKIRKIMELNDKEYDVYLEELYSETSSKDKVKCAMVMLASMHQTRAYRTLEEYVQQPVHTDEELVHWAYMAFMESRMNLEAELSDQRQVYISTGLGGKGHKLRFYALLLSSEGTKFLDYQREVIGKEFNYTFSKSDCEIERLTIADKYVELVFLLPIQTNIRTIFENAVNECNQYGQFISDVYTITNVKELDVDEVNLIVEKYGNSDSSH